MVTVYIRAVRLEDTVQQPLDEQSCYWLRETIATAECLWDLPKSLSISVSNGTWHVPAIVRIASALYPCAGQLLMSYLSL